MRTASGAFEKDQARLCAEHIATNGAMMLARREALKLAGKRSIASATGKGLAVRALSTPPPNRRLRQGGSIGADLVNGLKGLFSLPPNFRKYSK